MSLWPGYDEHFYVKNRDGSEYDFGLISNWKPGEGRLFGGSTWHKYSGLIEWHMGKNEMALALYANRGGRELEDELRTIGGSIVVP